MKNTSLITQTHVYFKKVFRISLREKAWKYIIFAAIISFIVAAITGPDMFKNFDRTNSGYFTLCSACIWIGIFNSIQSVCREHEIIRAEYRQGMKLSAYIFANVCWQALLCLVQSAIIFSISCIFTDFGKSAHLLVNPYVEVFITVYLMTFGAAVLGIMVSSLAGTPATAMTIMPFVLIVQLIMSGVLFELKDASEAVSYITLSKWGMSSFGSISDLNGYHLAIEEPLRSSGALMPGVSVMPNKNEFYSHESARLFISWAWIFGLTVFSTIVSIAALKIKNRDS